MKKIFCFLALFAMLCSCSSTSESYEGVKPVTIDIYEVYDADMLRPVVADLELPEGVELSPYTLLCAKNKAVMAEVDSLFAVDSVAAKLPGNVKLCWSKKPLQYPGAGYELYALKTESNGNCALDGSHVAGAELNDDNHSFSSFTITYDNDGAKIFEDLSEANNGKPLAIVADDKVLCAPRVNSAISGGKVMVTFDDGSIESLVRAINAGVAARQAAK